MYYALRYFEIKLEASRMQCVKNHKENMAYIHGRIFFSHKIWSHVVCRKINATGNNHRKQIKKISQGKKYSISYLICEAQILHTYIKSYMCIWQEGRSEII